MNLGQSLGMRHALVVEPLTRSVFRQVDRWLTESADHQRALEYVARRKNMDRYRDRTDFLFCETFPEWRRRCFAYYEERPGSAQLRSQTTLSQRVRYERQLVLVLQVAYETFCDRRRTTWGWCQVLHEARRRAA